MGWCMTAAVLVGALISWLATWGVRVFGPRLGLVDKPGHRKIHAKPMPTSGGIAIWLGVLLPFFLGFLALAWLIWQRRTGAEPLIALPEFIAVHLDGLWARIGRLWVLLAGGTLLMLLGLLDDRLGLSWKLRLGVQTLIACATVAAGFHMTIHIDLPWLTFPLSVLWIVGLINSFNMLDNMDGLSAGVAAIAAAMLAAVMFMAGEAESSGPQWFVGGFLLVLVGSLIGFLAHNRPPARIFMGDAGSYFIGYCLATATLAATFAGNTVPKHAILAPLCVLAVPLYDTVTVIFIRVKNGRSPFEGDKNHFSHRLVALGMSKPQAVGTIYLVSGTCGLGALLLHQIDGFGACVVLLMVTCVLVVIGVLEAASRRGADNE